jgi:S1-C subfamily serine protease
MPSSSTQNQQWLALSQEFSNVVGKVSSSLVAVHGGGRPGASGIHWGSGVIVTASHMVRRDDELSVTLPDRNSAAATLAGRDPSTDVAVLKIEKNGELSVIETASTAALKVGHVVLAVGRSHLGDVAASSGIVARIGEAWRTWRGGEIDQLLRPDVRIYPGQSGSALLNGQGQVLGMNTTALARVAAITVPAKTIDRVVEELLEHGHIRRPYLGLAMQTVALPEKTQEKLKLKSPTGLLVVHVEEGGPGGSAGITLGDVILGIQEKPADELSAVHDALRGMKTGDRAKLSVLRGGETREFIVTLGERPVRK